MYVVTNALGSFSGGGSKEKITNTFKEAMTLPQAARWKVASDKEIASLKKHGVYELVPITTVPDGRKAVGVRWVYKIKADEVYKGRLVVLGWSQVTGIDCDGTFAPVCRLQSIRMILAIAAELDYEVYMLDVQTAFLNADVEKEGFVKMAPGYERSNESGVPIVMKLKKRLYGLRQSPKNWFSTMDHHLGKIGFRSLRSDPCVYVYKDENGSAIMTLYVSDVLLLGANKQLLDKFKVTDMGNMSRVLGVNVTRDREEGTTAINQKDYTEDIVQRYGMRSCNPAYTPGVGPELFLDQPEENLLNEEGKRRYQPITGVVILLAQISRYDILCTINQLARAMSKSSKAHMEAAEHLLRYLPGPIDFSIAYKLGVFKLTVFEGLNNWGGRGYDDFVPREVTKIDSSGDRTTRSPTTWSASLPRIHHLTKGLVKYVPGRGYFRAVSSQNGDKLVTSPPPPIVGRVFFKRKPGSKLRQREVYIIIHHHAFQRPDQLQGGHSRINCTIYNRGGIGGGGAHHEGSSLLQQHDTGVRLQGRVRQRATLHRQHIDTSRRQQPHIQPSREAHRAEILLCAGISGGGQDHHPLCENTRPNRRSRNQARQQAPSPCPHQAHQEVRGVKHREIASDVVGNGSTRD